MTDEKTWPLEFKEKLILGSIGSNVGILTLWTTKELIAEKLDPKSFAVIGNFYDVFNGLEPFVRNCLANPKLRYFIVVGNDRSGSKKTIMNFFEKGVADGVVKETDVPFSVDIPIEDADQFRSSSKIFDLTAEIEDLSDPFAYKHAIEKVLATLEPLPPYAEPRTYPKTESVPSVFPSSSAVFKAEGKLVSEVWLLVLKTIASYGEPTQMGPCESSAVKECIDLVSVVHEEDPDEPNLPGFFRFDKEKLFAYYKTFCEGTKPKDSAYTYGYRFDGVERQFENIKTLLKQNLYSKRAYASTWQKGDIFADTPPCVISLQPNFHGGKLFMTAYMRSNDMFRAWPLNAFGMRKIQKNFAKFLGVQMGSLVIVSQSAHVYKENFKEMEIILNKHYKRENPFFDPRGYYTVKVECGEIVMEHFEVCGKKLRTLQGAKARQLCDLLSSEIGPEDPFHLTYIACELMKAELAIKFGLNYKQDEELVK